MDELRNCGDCGVKSGEIHQDGCDVERCCLCGGQAISCHCVYQINGVEDPGEVTQEMRRKHEEEEAKYGGRLPWTGLWPNTAECHALGLFCYWGDPKTKEPIKMEVGVPGAWISCEKDHPEAGEDWNRFLQVTTWDKVQRKRIPRV